MTSLSHSNSSEDIPSIFGDGYCGEPLETQQLLIDFTQNDEDTDFIQKKCCAFWEMVNNSPELKKMMVYPEPIVKQQMTSSSVTSVATTESLEKPMNLERTAVSMLAFAEEKGLIDRTFEAKLPYTTCSLGSREYHENEPTRSIPKALGKSVCKCAGECESCVSRFPAPPASSPDVVELCKKMKTWDEQHPKIMDEPSHAPALSHCVMQRKY